MDSLANLASSSSALLASNNGANDAPLPPRVRIHRNLANITWSTWKALGSDIEKRNDGSQKLTTNAVDAYQTMEEIPLMNIPAIDIPYDLEVTDGNVTVGILSGNQANWLGQKAFPVGKHSGTLKISTENQERVFLVVQSNAKGQVSQATLNKLEVWLRE